MTVESHPEVELKFDVGDEVPVPQLASIPGVAGVGEPAVHDLDAVYYDTAEHDLAAVGITLRRRTGGGDAGWHLKLPVGDRQREELRLPAGEPDSAVPDAFLETTRAARRDHVLVPVARIHTHREVHSLLDHQGRVLAEFCDDRVRADRCQPGSGVSWREWEVELVEGPPSLLDRCAELLVHSGASPSGVGSKLARVLGQVAGGAVPATSSDPQTAGDVMVAYLGEQLEQLRLEDPLVRAGAPDSVHKMRVAARRARSALATYAPLLEPRAGDALSDELRWLGTVLGEARDAEVLRDRFARLMAYEPGPVLRGEVTQGIAAELDDRRTRGLTNADDLLASERYHRLPGLFERFIASAPLTARAERPARAEVARLVERDWVRLDRRARVAAAASGRRKRDRALHDVRKAAKRLRYAAESAIPALGQRADELATSCATIQDLLGEHHDSVVARALLHDVRHDVGSAAGSDHVLDRLQAREKEEARVVAREYEAAFAALPHEHRKRWLRGSGPV